MKPISTARRDSSKPMGFSTSTPSTSSQSRFSRAWIAMTSSSVAVPGGGRIRMRSGGMSPSDSSRSATVSTAGGALVPWLIEILQDIWDLSSFAGEVVAVGTAIVLVGVEDGLHALGLARGLRGGDEGIVLAVPGRRSDADLFRIVAADHIQVDVCHDPGICRQTLMVGKPFAAQKPLFLARNPQERHAPRRLRTLAECLGLDSNVETSHATKDWFLLSSG